MARLKTVTREEIQEIKRINKLEPDTTYVEPKNTDGIGAHYVLTMGGQEYTIQEGLENLRLVKRLVEGLRAVQTRSALAITQDPNDYTFHVHIRVGPYEHTREGNLFDLVDFVEKSL